MAREAPVALYGLYFLCGLTGEFPDIARYFYLRDCGFSIASIGLVDGLLSATWLLAVPAGYLSDVSASRRRFVLGLQTTMLCVWAALALLEERPRALNAALVVFDEACVVAWATALDALMVRHVRRDAQRRGHVQFVGGAAYFAGRTTGALAGGLARTHTSSRRVFALQAGVVLVAMLVSAWLDEEQAAAGPPVVPAATRARSLVAEVWEALETPELRRSALFLFALFCVPTTKVVVFYFLTDTRGFAATDVGLVDAASFLSIAAAQYLYQSLRLGDAEDVLYVAAVLSSAVAAVGTRLLLLRWNAVLGVGDLAMAMLLPAHAAFVTLALCPYNAFLAERVGEEHQATVYALLGMLPTTGRYVASALLVQLVGRFGVRHDNFDGAPALSSVVAVLALAPALPLMWCGCGELEERERAAGDEEEREGLLLLVEAPPPPPRGGDVGPSAGGD